MSASKTTAAKTPVAKAAAAKTPVQKAGAEKAPAKKKVVAKAKPVAGAEAKVETKTVARTAKPATKSQSCNEEERRGQGGAGGSARGKAGEEARGAPPRQRQRAGDRRVARQGEDDQEVPRRRLHREGVGRPRQGSAQDEDGHRHRARLPARVRGHRRQEEGPRGDQEGGQERRAASSSRPTPIARARRSPGTSPRRSRPSNPQHPARPLQRDHQEGDHRGDRAAAASSTSRSSSRSRRAASSTAWSATRSARSCGRRCSAGCRPGACSRSRCAWSSSASAEIAAFKPEEYWTVEATSRGSAPPPFTAPRSQARRQEGRADQRRATRREVVDELKRGAVRRRRASSARSGARTRRRRSSRRKLQQEASRKLRFSPKRTMALAQRLYEGVELGDEGPVGLITYMRTDSTRLSDDAVTEARAYIARALRRGRSCPPSRSSTRRKKAAQDAHEAIRPTSLKYDPETVRQPVAGGKGGGRDERETEDLLQALHADLEPLRRLPDDAGGLRPDHRRHRAPGRVRPARHRPGA